MTAITTTSTSHINSIPIPIFSGMALDSESTWWWGRFEMLKFSINFQSENEIGGYYCSICKKEFGSKRFDVLRNHISIKHSYYLPAITGIKRISITCEFCLQPLKCTGYAMRLHKSKCKGLPGVGDDNTEMIQNSGNGDISDMAMRETEHQSHLDIANIISTSKQLRKELKLMQIAAKRLIKSNKKSPQSRFYH